MKDLLYVLKAHQSLRFLVWLMLEPQQPLPRDDTVSKPAVTVDGNQGPRSHFRDHMAAFTGNGAGTLGTVLVICGIFH